VNDTCDAIVATNRISSTQLLSWNPNINSLCGNLWSVVNDVICLR
jgi:hypothetical protein